jgi:predicted DNA binding CopG/RHH family protein
MDMPNHERRLAQHDRRVSFRMPASLLAMVEQQAGARGLPLSTFVRTALRHEVEAE